jgi:hypothetical protein
MADFVPKDVCDERHTSLKDVRDEITKKNDSDHEVIDERFSSINVSIQELSKATNTSLERVHSRIDTLSETMGSKFEEVLKTIFSIQDSMKNKVIWMLVGIVGSLIIAIASMVWQIVKPDKSKSDLTKIEESLVVLDRKSDRNKLNVEQHMNDIAGKLDSHLIEVNKKKK